MNIEELVNSKDIEIAEMYCNIYIQTHTFDELKNIVNIHDIRYISSTNTVMIFKLTIPNTNNIWLKDPSRIILLNIE